VYHSDFKQSHHDELLDLGRGKVIALGEVGEVPAPVVLTLQPLWTWFMIWSDFVNSHNTPLQIRSLYEDPRTLSHGEVAGDR
jgi:mannan endo-1,4-beta-mannosidase